jgi:hypothetical protein
MPSWTPWRTPPGRRSRVITRERARGAGRRIGPIATAARSRARSRPRSSRLCSAGSRGGTSAPLFALPVTAAVGPPDISAAVGGRPCSISPWRARRSRESAVLVRSSRWRSPRPSSHRSTAVSRSGSSSGCRCCSRASWGRRLRGRRDTQRDRRPRRRLPLVRSQSPTPRRFLLLCLALDAAMRRGQPGARRQPRPGALQGHPSPQLRSSRASPRPSPPGNRARRAPRARPRVAAAAAGGAHRRQLDRLFELLAFRSSPRWWLSKQTRATTIETERIGGRQ